MVEAARRSGSLITARFALEQGREVFAVPGSPLDPRAEGANDLIRNGATMVTRWEDILEVIAPQIESGEVRPAQLSEDRERNGNEETLWDELIADDGEGATATIPVWEGPEEEVTPPTGPDPLSRVMEALGPSPVAVDDIARMLQLDIRQVQAALFELEMSGRLERQGGNRVALVRPAD